MTGQSQRLAEGGAADGAGLSPVLACYPTLRPGVVVGQVVRARNPRIEMRLEPESLLRERAGGAWFTVAFSAWQVGVDMKRDEQDPLVR